MHAWALQAVRPEDEAFLADLFVQCHAGRVQLWAWPDAEVAAFLRQQFMAQQWSYRQQFGAQHDRLIWCDGTAVGRLFVVQHPDGLYLVDIAVLPSHQGQGLGTQVLKQLQWQVQNGSGRLRLRVQRDNPALRLYERLGFMPTGGDELHWDLIWPAADPGARTEQADRPAEELSAELATSDQGTRHAIP